MTLMAWGQGDEGEKVLAESIAFEARSGVPHPSFVIGWQRFFSGERWEEWLLLRGQMQLAHTLAWVAITGLPLVHLLLARNELDEARRHLTRIQPIVESLDQYVFPAQLPWCLAKLQTAQGNLLEAQASYERLLKTWKATDDTLFILPMLLDGIAFYPEVGNLLKTRPRLVS